MMHVRAVLNGKVNPRAIMAPTSFCVTYTGGSSLSANTFPVRTMSAEGDDIPESRSKGRMLCPLLHQVHPSQVNSIHETKPPRCQVDAPYAHSIHRYRDLCVCDTDTFGPNRILDARLHKYLTPNPLIPLLQRWAARLPRAKGTNRRPCPSASHNLVHHRTRPQHYLPGIREQA